MAHMKLDGIIEAVHYTPGGKIALVRSYERHGVVWSDVTLLERKELVERLKQGKHFVTGKRKSYLGSVLQIGAAVQSRDDNIVTAGKTGEGDFLDGVPVF
jgi:uncharacterized protein YjhX (UPF0386 family)